MSLRMAAVVGVPLTHLFQVFLRKGLNSHRILEKLFPEHRRGGSERHKGWTPVDTAMHYLDSPLGMTNRHHRHHHTAAKSVASTPGASVTFDDNSLLAGGHTSFPEQPTSYV